MNKPKRIQRKRVKGWKMPPNTVYVGRPTKWGNPFFVGLEAGDAPALLMTRAGLGHVSPLAALNKWECVKLFECLVEKNPGTFELSFLRGKNLACWCAKGEPCHADVLLKLANA